MTPVEKTAANDAEAKLAALIRQPSVTPEASGALDLAETWLKGAGFDCHRLVFEAEGTPPVDNLFARIGTTGPHFCFAGHLDVVPVGDEAAWSVPPFSAQISDGKMIGRGAEDMKGGVAAFLAAAFAHLAKRGGELPGSLSVLLTGDEEGPAINGTVKVLEWMATHGHVPDHCLVGEPTGVDRLGDVAKIGRRGSLNGHLVIHGKQGHVAYPYRARNPIPPAFAFAAALLEPLDQGTAHFEPSNLEITAIDTDNQATNIIPGSIAMRFNCRFNDTWTSQRLEAELRHRLETCSAKLNFEYQLQTASNAESFVTDTGEFTELITGAVADATGVTPQLTTGGGTSDARFITRHCPVVEFGLVGQTMHQVDENVPLADLAKLTGAYQLILERYFEASKKESA